MVWDRHRRKAERGAGGGLGSNGDRPLWDDIGRMMDGDPPATEAELRAEQMARLREEMRRREVEG